MCKTAKNGLQYLLIITLNNKTEYPILNAKGRTGQGRAEQGRAGQDRPREKQCKPGQGRTINNNLR